MERGMASTPKTEYQVFLCIFQKNSAMATLGLKEMGKFLWEWREKGLPCWLSQFSPKVAIAKFIGKMQKRSLLRKKRPSDIYLELTVNFNKVFWTFRILFCSSINIVQWIWIGIWTQGILNATIVGFVSDTYSITLKTRKIIK